MNEEKPESTLTEEQQKIIDDIKRDHKENSKYYRRILYVMYSLALVGLLIFVKYSPTFTEEDWQVLKQFPNSLERLRASVKVIKSYSEENPVYVYALFVYMYLSLQSLGIIGCGVLSIMSGALFSFPTAIITVSLCASFGATVCYLFSKSLFRGFIVSLQEKRIANFAVKIERNRRYLFFYFISLRFSPIFPNLFVNLASPIVGVDIKTFFFGTLIGLIPLNVIHAKTGATLDSISDIGAKPMDVGFLGLISIAVLIPTFFNKKKKVE
jgi:uncharacterized membrane protein YdjX (TVP38/TMEM64 family)